MKRTLGLALLFTVIYILVFASPLQKHPAFTPQWVQNLTEPSRIAPQNGSETIGFRIGDIFGYFTPRGAIKYLDTTQFNVAMSDGRFVNFSSVSKTLVEKDSSGRITQTIDSRGYPILTAGRFFLIDSNRTAISELGSEGNVTWSREFGSLITTMDANATSVVVGLLNGSLDVVDKNGKIAYSFTPGGSRVAVLYGCGISPDGEYIAVVSGLAPQKFILLRRASSGYRPVRVVDLTRELRRQVFVHFYPHVPYVYVESEGEVEYFPLQGGRTGTIPVEGRLAGMAAGRGPLIYAVSHAVSSSGSSPAGTAQLTVFTPAGEVIARSNFAGRSLFLKTSGDAVYLGVDRELVRFDSSLQ